MKTFFLQLRQSTRTAISLPAVHTLLILISLWVLSYLVALSTAVQQWYISEIYTHGFLVLPVSLFIAWRHRAELATTQVSPSWLPLLFLSFFSVAGIIGYAGDIYVISHIAAFVSLPLLIWLALGNRVALVLWFPLLFLLFAVPIGDQLIPHLQEITADLAVAMLSLTDIPIFRTGLYIEIPAGRFVVAEACSGIRFFIGSIVFGSVYAYISFQNLPKRAIFMVLSVLIPVIANAIRVFGIILIGHFSDMKYAAGADHLVYGWFFFAVVLLCLILIGEKFSDTKPLTKTATHIDPSWSSSTLKNIRVKCAVMVLLICCSWKAWMFFANTDDDSTEAPPLPNTLTEWTELQTPNIWTPLFLAASEETLRQFGQLTVYRAHYHKLKGDADLISSENRFYRPNAWTLVQRKRYIIELSDQTIQTTHLELTDITSRRLHVMYWYELNKHKTGNTLEAKMWQTLDIMLGGTGSGTVYAIATPELHQSVDLAKKILSQK